MALNLTILSDYALYRLARTAPLSWSRMIGEYLGLESGRKRLKMAERAARNLRLLRPDLTDPAEIQAILDQRWRNIGRNMLQLVAVDLIWRRGLVEVVGREHLDEALAAGGRVAFTAVHLANWELIAAATAYLAPPVIATFEPRQSKARNHIIALTRARYGIEMHAGGLPSARRLHQAVVQGNHNLLMFIDEIRNNQVAFPAFGRSSEARGNLPILVKLAAAAKLPILPLYMRHRADGGFTLIILPACVPLLTPAGKPDLPANARMFEDIYAPLIKTHADQWLMLHDLRLP